MKATNAGVLTGQTFLFGSTEGEWVQRVARDEYRVPSVIWRPGRGNTGASSPATGRCRTSGGGGDGEAPRQHSKQDPH